MCLIDYTTKPPSATGFMEKIVFLKQSGGICGAFIETTAMPVDFMGIRDIINDAVKIHIEAEVLQMIQLLCYGDSNTWGFNPGTSGRYPWGVRWTSVLQEKLDPYGVRVLEEGLCGRTTVYEDSRCAGRNGLAELPMVLDTHRPIEAAVLMLGTNDCKTCYGLDAETIAEGMGRCLDCLLRELDPQKILAVAPMPLGDRIGEDGFDTDFDNVSLAVSSELFPAYRAVCERRRIALLNAGDYVRVSDIDQEHLDESGHARFAEVVFRALLEMNIVNRN